MPEQSVMLKTGSLATDAAPAVSWPDAPQFQELFAPFPAERRDVRVSFSSSGGTFEARVFLTLPTGNLVGCTPSPLDDPAAAVDEAVRMLAEQLRLHARQLRRDQLRDRDRRRARDLAAAQSCLTLFRVRGDEEGFYDVLRPLLRAFREHAARELVLSQLTNEVAPGTMSVGELLDETAARAWGQWDGGWRVPLNRILVCLLHAALDARAEWVGELSCPRGAAAAAGATFEVDDGWALAGTPFWPFDESIAADDILGADDAPAHAELPRSVVDNRRAVLRELSRFPKDRRRALALHAFEGWPVGEVAVLQRRPEAEMRRLIRMTRVTLLERLGAPAGEA